MRQRTGTAIKAGASFEQAGNDRLRFKDEA